MKTAGDVKTFWDSNPLLHGELHSTPGTIEFINDFDRIKTEDIFLGDISDWILPSMKGKKVLDVGCGPGYWSRRINEVGGLYTGVDISSTSVALTKKSLELLHHRGEVIEANAENLPFENATFDYVISEGVIHHTPNTQRCVDEIFRVLKPGGEAIISVYYKNVLLRSPLAFSLATAMMRLTGYGLKGRGREKMSQATSPEEFVRMYDGADNPVGKAYGHDDIQQMFGQFKIDSTKIYYLPVRASKVGLPKFAFKLAMPIAGTMIMVRAHKQK